MIDSGNHRIQQFTAAGQFIASVGTKGNKALQFKYPSGITFNACNNKIYVVDENHRVQILNSDLTFSFFGKYGSCKGQFDDPYDIACDSTGKMYVADSDNSRIQIFTADGIFIRMLSRNGIQLPISITIDSNDTVYVGDFNHRILVYTCDGKLITYFGGNGTQSGRFNYPRGLAVDSCGVLYVCDRNNGKTILTLCIITMNECLIM